MIHLEALWELRLILAASFCFSKWMVLMFDDVWLKLWHGRMFVAENSCYLPQFSDGVIVFIPLFLHFPQLLLHSLHLWLFLLQDTWRCSFQTSKQHTFQSYLKFHLFFSDETYILLVASLMQPPQNHSDNFFLTIRLIHIPHSVLQKNDRSTFRLAHCKSRQTRPFQEKLRLSSQHQPNHKEASLSPAVLYR